MLIKAAAPAGRNARPARPVHGGPAARDLLTESALTYARLGWRVFPLWPGSKRPVFVGSFYQATTDPARIAAWWRANPAYNIGLATGAGLLALDLDPAHGARPWLQAHADLLGPTICARSGGGGWHFLYTLPPAVAIRNSVGRLAPGVDVRGDGGYLVLPPSRHPNGRRYAWQPDAAPWQCAPGPLAAPLLAVLQRAPTPTRARRGRGPLALPLGPTIPAGTRNATLFSLAGTMRRRNMSPAAILAALQVENATRCRPPLPPAEVARLVHNICRYPPAPADEGDRHA